MATYRERLQTYCSEKGLSGTEAAQVVEQFIGDSELCSEYVASRIDRPDNDLPPQTLPLLIIGVKSTALKWIEKNAPQAWYKPLFLE